MQLQTAAIDEGFRIAIVGAGGYGRVALDVLVAAGAAEWILGFYDDGHAMLPARIRGFSVLGDIKMLESMLSVEPVHVVVAITDNAVRLRIANSFRALGARFFSAVHPRAYLSDESVVGDGTVVAAGAVVHPDSAVGSHSYIGPLVVVDRDVVVGAGAWLSSGAAVGAGARLGARVLLGQNAIVGRKASVASDEVVPPLGSVLSDGPGGKRGQP